ncbi:hypothetical protein BD770DRAFT_416750 [Pilaira anomala]|nr:hypothetical protein BD770DRAFT_416750 [Pilaira anomala]
MTSVPNNTVLAHSHHASNYVTNPRNRLIEFGGDEGEDYRHFEKRLESYFALSDINNDKRKLLILQTQLQHSARAFFDDLITTTTTIAEKNTYKAISDLMRNEYITPQLIRRYQLAFNAMCQGHNEPPRVYLGRLKEAAKLADIKAEELIEMRFQTGLHTEIIVQCRLMGAESFHECLKVADGYWNAYHQKVINIVDNPFIARGSAEVHTSIPGPISVPVPIVSSNGPILQSHIPTAVPFLPTPVPTAPVNVPKVESPSISFLTNQLKELQLNHMEANAQVVNINEEEKLQAMIDESIKRHLAASNKNNGYNNNSNNNNYNGERRGRYNNNDNYRGNNNENYRNNNNEIIVRMIVRIIARMIIIEMVITIIATIIIKMMDIDAMIIIVMTIITAIIIIVMKINKDMTIEINRNILTTLEMIAKITRATTVKKLVGSIVNDGQSNNPNSNKSIHEKQSLNLMIDSDFQQQQYQHSYDNDNNLNISILMVTIINNNIIIIRIMKKNFMPRLEAKILSLTQNQNTKKNATTTKQLKSKVSNTFAPMDPEIEAEKNVSFAPSSSYIYHSQNNNDVEMKGTSIPMAPTLTQAFVPGEKKKRRRRVKPKISYDIATDVLEQNANIKVKELIAINPTLKKQLMSACRIAATSLDPSQAAIQELNYNESTKDDIESTAVYSRFIISNIEIKTLVDCGASKTCMSKALVDSLGFQIDGPSNSVFTLGNGTKHASMGVIYEVPIKAAGIVIPCTVEVLAVMPIPLLIGTNWLHRANAVINFPKKIMKIRYKQRSATVPIEYITKNDITTPLNESDQISTDESDSSSEESITSDSEESDNAELYMLEDDITVNTLLLTVDSKCILPAKTQRTFFLDKPMETTPNLIYDFQLHHSQNERSLSRYTEEYDVKFISLDYQFQISISNNSEHNKLSMNIQSLALLLGLTLLRTLRWAMMSLICWKLNNITSPTNEILKC